MHSMKKHGHACTKTLIRQVAFVGQFSGGADLREDLAWHGYRLVGFLRVIDVIV